ncbi:MAG TPA: type II secretion system protein GspC [Steroidobacteraceae bacterium]|nr:type II secretion system protein GspC [Steroidobacteraceae bacterium]
MSSAAGTGEIMSVRALTRLLAERGAQLAVVVLIIALGLDSALILTRALNPLGAQPPAAGAALIMRHGLNPQLALATIVNAHLFGTAAVATGPNAPPTNMALILAGVIAEKNPAHGQAIIGPNAAAAKLYSVGAMISGGVRLHAVYADRVLLEHNGGLETLMLPRTPLPGASGLAPAQSAPTGTTMRANPAVLAGLVRVQPVFSQGKLSGYRIFPNGKNGPATFRQLGLVAGDMILAVNGTSLDDPARAMEVLQTLSSSGSATITVMRNGAAQEVNLNLANLSGDEQYSGAQGADPSAPSPGPAIRRPMILPAPNALGTTAGSLPGQAAPQAGALER